jgi:hypothetical protein
VRIIARMGTAPPARVEVVDRPASVVIALFERRPPRFSPDGIPLSDDQFLIAITATFDILLSTPLRGRRLIDGVTGFDPATVRGGRRSRVDAPPVDETESRVEVPIGRTFDWKELTGRPWFDLELSDSEPTWPEAKTVFFTFTEDVPTREQPEGGQERLAPAFAATGHSRAPTRPTAHRAAGRPGDRSPTATIGGASAFATRHGSNRPFDADRSRSGSGAGALKR